MTVTPLNDLSKWINSALYSDGLVPRQIMHSDNAALASAVEECGLWRIDRVATEIDCPLCPEDHIVKVCRGDREEFEFYCIQNGWDAVSREALEFSRFDRDRLIRELARASGIKTNRVTQHAQGNLFRFGMVSRDVDNADWILAYADRLESDNVRSGVVDAIAGHFSSGPGLVATPSLVPLNIPLPRNYKLIALHDCFGLQGSELVLRSDMIATRLGISKKAPGQAGRPSYAAKIEKIWLEQIRKPDWPSGRDDQANRILDHWPPSPTGKPQLGTVKNQLPRLEKNHNWARVGSRRTKPQNT